MLDFATAGTVINRAAAQLGLLSTAPAMAGDPFGSTNPAFVQLCDLLTTVGDSINSAHEWPQTRKECLITTIAGQNSYPLPSDFHEQINQSGFNRTTRGFPMIGPLSSVEWQFLKARTVGVFISVAFRLSGANIELNPGNAPPANTLLAFEYQSSLWAASNGATSPDKSAPTAQDDTVWFDSELMIVALKLAYSTDRGFDTAALEAAYKTKLEHAIGKSTGAPVLDLSGKGALTYDRLVDGANLPLTGWGLP